MVGKYRKEVGNYLKSIRKNKNITAKSLGANLQYSQSHISGIENGSKKIPPFFIPAYLNYVSDSNEEYNYYADQIAKITEGNFEVEKRQIRKDIKEILNSISKPARMKEFYNNDYNNEKTVTIFSENINDLNFHLEDNLNSKFYKTIELSDYDRKNISKILDIYFINKEELLESIRYDYAGDSLDILALQDKIEEIQNVFKKD
ncbi:helix-turn-helix transcriptional regulator [Staphylococcus epidermidis]|uniref:HTH cro/C1-type domain-containing protein n=1 Tax=Staphylococcus caprae TaxID=29380 RepID=A0ABN5W738_9STAP|nr:helix-turn-helix transcriptional regulator [Staphylococcus caprae]MCG1059635.1 helix-turn-helix transcriptional regulator [Staphylococcus epidermidis]MCG1866929.1 helix-turn-helix transcriptional regulator [Staphylococcus epidermidis]MCG2072015.1 helix-turn-helix transcriptional regulator [Staphylococcus epidermidis]MCG2243013.1 helix-turn-helix transcriptional regulator [Staphylococcus epidermidis]MCG2244383.1 helix-turn-helix transcriptional regulator [Staphylococcus epidermidis]